MNAMAFVLALVLAGSSAVATEKTELKVGNVSVIASYVTVTMTIPDGDTSWTVKCVVLNADGDPLGAEDDHDVTPPAHSMTLLIGDRAGEARSARCLGQPN